MLNLLPMLLLLGFCIAVLMLVRRRVLSQRRDNLAALAAGSSAADAVIARKVLRTLRSRNLAALAAAAIGAAGAIFFTEAFPRLNGLLMVAAPAIMAVLAAAVYAFWRIPHEFPTADPSPSGRISADLTPRSTGMFGPAWGIVLPGVLLVGTLVGTACCGDVFGSRRKGPLPKPPACLHERRAAGRKPRCDPNPHDRRLNRSVPGLVLRGARHGAFGSRRHPHAVGAQHQCAPSATAKRRIAGIRPCGSYPQRICPQHRAERIVVFPGAASGDAGGVLNRQRRLQQHV